MINNISVFDFFSGCGGTSQGFHQAGLDIAFGLDLDEFASETFKLNFPKAKVINSDITKLDVTCIEDVFNKAIARNKYTLFSGCAPCQPFSTQNRIKKITDPRIDLLREFSKFIKQYQPDFVFIENVPGMQKLKDYATPFSDFIDDLNSLGYKYSFDVVSALWFGVPQDRKRLIMLASKCTEITLPNITHDGNNIPFSTVKEWIYDLPPIRDGETHDFIPDHQAASLNELNIARIKCTPEGKGRESWPDRLKLKCHSQHSGHKDVYGRLAWDKPSSVLTTRCTSYSNGRFGHPEQNRALTLREAALLQTFPLNYKFVGNFNSKAKQIGNAVPPLMSEAIGNYLMSLI
ncbi:MAG TPA: DNA (cytosine-5-)-methyltransferase [Morganella sp. (in: Bacteria)]|nr:DNA (cytosine-5-)-methyltransferase [Morganella sp. (in: enterobacteria)]